MQSYRHAKKSTGKRDGITDEVMASSDHTRARSKKRCVQIVQYVPQHADSQNNLGDRNLCVTYTWVCLSIHFLID